MKESSKSVIVALLFIASFVVYAVATNTYERTATVIEVEMDDITVKDTCGYVWDFKGTDFVEGDKVRLKMNCNGTDSIVEDDRIMDVIKID